MHAPITSEDSKECLTKFVSNITHEHIELLKLCFDVTNANYTANYDRTIEDWNFKLDDYKNSQGVVIQYGKEKKAISIVSPYATPIKTKNKTIYIEDSSGVRAYPLNMFYKIDLICAMRVETKRFGRELMKYMIQSLPRDLGLPDLKFFILELIMPDNAPGKNNYFARQSLYQWYSINGFKLLTTANLLDRSGNIVEQLKPEWRLKQMNQHKNLIYNYTASIFHFTNNKNQKLVQMIYEL
jgi:hypothetical protein